MTAAKHPITRAESAADFAEVLELITMMSAWDLEQTRALGVPEADLLDVHYGDSIESLMEKFLATGATMLLVRIDQKMAGTIGYSVVGDKLAEIHKLFVDPAFRGLGLGAQLLDEALGQIDAFGGFATRLQTARFMVEAIQLYGSRGFARCAPFSDAPESFADMEVFMMRPAMGW